MSNRDQFTQISMHSQPIAFLCGVRTLGLALVALRFNPDMKAKYQLLKNAQKPSKVAITAIMRKLIILANTRVKNDRMWVNNRA